MEPPSIVPSNGDMSDRPNGSERVLSNGKREEKGSSSSKFRRISPKSELNKTKGSVNAKGRREEPNGELKKGSDKNGSNESCRWLRLRCGPASADGGGQTPCWSYSCRASVCIEDT